MSLAVQRAFASLPNFTQPIAMLQEPGNSARWYVVQKTGSVRVFDNTPNVSTTREFINLASRLNSDPSSSNDERGLLGMAFHPNYPTDPRVFLFYTGTHTTLGLVDRVSQFRLAAGGTTLDPASELELLNVDDPESNHNGGNIAFGPDGFLYIGIGDGGGGGDGHGTIGNGQLLTTLLGKMLRIDVAAIDAWRTHLRNSADQSVSRPTRVATPTAPAPPTVPRSTPTAFAIRGAGASIACSDQLWLNDVGQSALEEVDLVTLGGNYGWRCFEGTNPFNAHLRFESEPHRRRSRSTAARSGSPPPAASSIAAARFPRCNGRYVFGDFGSGNLWNIARDTAPTLNLTAAMALSTGLQIASFGEDTDGEVYIVHLGGTLHRLVQGTGGGRQIPTQLSATGCVNADHADAAGERTHSLCAERAVLLRRRGEDALARVARRPAHRRRRQTTTSISRTAACW